jgi:NAD(P)-dependent dehydrogenase (short-subunit alcohol dehydrogenase family)
VYGPQESYNTESPVALDSFGETVDAPLGHVVLGRSGDKASDANVGFFVSNEEQWDWLRSFLTIGKLKELLGPDEYFGNRIDRFEMKNIRVVHFLLKDHLDRGYNSGSKLDTLAKNLCEYLRAKTVPMPRKFFGSSDLTTDNNGFIYGANMTEPDAGTETDINCRFPTHILSPSMPDTSTVLHANNEATKAAQSNTLSQSTIMSLPFSDKVIAITGAASGIALATAKLLAKRGAKLSLADIQVAALEKAKAEIEAETPGAEVLISVVDVSKYDQVDAWTKATIQKFGKLTGAANLAGVIPKSIGVTPLSEQSFDDWEFVMGVNSTGVMHCLRSQLGAIADGGSIVNASSIAGTTGRANNAAYSASKHAVLGLTRSAAKEVGVRGVRVNAICP